MTKQEKARNARIRCTYGKSLAWYKRQLKKQGGHCYCCDFTPGWRRNKKGKLTFRCLHIEHDHRLAGLYIYVKKKGSFYVATVKHFKKKFKSRRKNRAKKLMKRWLRSKSVRGLVCWPCNSLIRKSYDQPDRLAKAAEMLDKHQKKMRWRKYGTM